MTDPLDRFAEQQRRIQGAARAAEADEETVVSRPPPSAREAAASGRHRPLPPASTEPEERPTKAQLDELETKAITDVLRLTHEIARVGETQTQLVAMLRRHRPTVFCTPAVVADLERAARAALDECAPLNLQGRVDVITRALTAAWHRGAAAARGES
jgi:hypothetical protein